MKGTVLGPLVFLLYFNDFQENVQKNFDKTRFADVTTIHFSSKNVDDLKKCVSGILEKKDNLLKQNKLTMSSGKTELLCVSKKNQNFDKKIFR